jgi:hypothetical protein
MTDDQLSTLPAKDDPPGWPENARQLREQQTALAQYFQDLIRRILLLCEPAPCSHPEEEFPQAHPGGLTNHWRNLAAHSAQNCAGTVFIAWLPRHLL